MKAHVRKSSQQPKETVLLYHLEPEKEKKARQVLENCGAKVITASPEDSEQTLGALLGMDGFPRFEGEPDQKAESEAILFSGFDNTRLKVVLSRLKSAQASTPYKAVLTVNNQGWTIAHLIGELAKEHNLLSRLDQLRGLTRQLLQHDPKKLSEQNRQDAVDSLAKAQSIMKRPSSASIDDIDMTIAGLQRSIAMAMAADINHANHETPVRQKDESEKTE